MHYVVLSLAVMTTQQNVTNLSVLRWHEVNASGERTCAAQLGKGSALCTARGPAGMQTKPPPHKQHGRASSKALPTRLYDQQLLGCHK